VNVITPDAWLTVGVSVGIAIGTAAFIIVAWAVRALLRKVDTIDREQGEVNREILRITQEIHNKVDTHGQRIAYIEGLNKVPLGSSTNLER